MTRSVSRNQNRIDENLSTVGGGRSVFCPWALRHGRNGAAACAACPRHRRSRRRPRVPARSRPISLANVTPDSASNSGHQIRPMSGPGLGLRLRPSSAMHP